MRVQFDCHVLKSNDLLCCLIRIAKDKNYFNFKTMHYHINNYKLLISYLGKKQKGFDWKRSKKICLFQLFSGNRETDD